MNIIGRRMSHVQVGALTDQVISEYPLPNECTLNQVNLKCSLVGDEETPILSAAFYGISGFVVPILDPDQETAVDTIWDNLVPKDVAEGAAVFDLDTAAADATPEYNFGEPDWGAVFGMAGNRPLELFRRRKMVTFAESPVGWLRVAAAPDHYIPVDFFRTVIRKKVRASTHSYILFGLSSPDTTQTTATIKTTLAETEWTMMTFMETFLEDAAKHLMGLIEAGAETPYEEASAFVAELIEKVAFEETAGAFDPQTWDCITQTTYNVTVPGTFKVGTLTSE